VLLSRLTGCNWQTARLPQQDLVGKVSDSLLISREQNPKVGYGNMQLYQKSLRTKDDLVGFVSNTGQLRSPKYL
jgi:hypothetical protein